MFGSNAGQNYASLTGTIFIGYTLKFVCSGPNLIGVSGDASCTISWDTNAPLTPLLFSIATSAAPLGQEPLGTIAINYANTRGNNGFQTTQNGYIFYSAYEIGNTPSSYTFTVHALTAGTVVLTPTILTSNYNGSVSNFRIPTVTLRIQAAITITPTGQTLYPGQVKTFYMYSDTIPAGTVLTPYFDNNLFQPALTFSPSPITLNPGTITPFNITYSNLQSNNYQATEIISFQSGVVPISQNFFQLTLLPTGSQIALPQRFVTPTVSGFIADPQVGDTFPIIITLTFPPTQTVTYTITQVPQLMSFAPSSVAFAAGQTVAGTVVTVNSVGIASVVLYSDTAGFGSVVF